MTSVATGIGVIFAVGLNAAPAFVPQTPPPPNPKPPVQASAMPTQAEITVTGCLVQGSAANVFVLQDAKRDPASATEKAARYVVAPATEDLFLKQHISHQVRILGVPDGRPQPTAQAGATAVDEKLVPALSAKSLTMVSASCSRAGGDWGDGSGGGGGGGRSGGGSIGLGAAGFSGLNGFMSSNFGTAGSRFGSGFGSTGFASTSSVFGGGGSRGPEAEEPGNWAPHGYVPGLENFPEFAPEQAPGLENFPEFASEQAVEALINHVARTTAVELLGQDVPTSGIGASPAADVPIANPEPGTLLLIASGLLLVVYAGRRREWHAFGRRSVR